MDESIKVLPAVALRGTTVLPGMIIHFDVSRSRSIAAVENAMTLDRKVFLITQKSPDTEDPDIIDLYKVGTIARVDQIIKLSNDRVRVLVEGECRASILSLRQKDPFLRAGIILMEDNGPILIPAAREAMCRSLKTLFERYCQENEKISREIQKEVQEPEDLNEVITQISTNLPINWKQKQQILEAATIEKQYEVIAAILTNETNVLMIGHDLQKKLKNAIDKNQREYILREQIKVIRKELGEDNIDSALSQYREKLAGLRAPEDVKEKIDREIKRFSHMNQSSPEANVLSGYLDTVLALPWNEKSRDSEDLERAGRILEEQHYGLNEVKERVMEFLAVRKLTKGGKSPILCLVGPPGTGKTSIAKSIAEALEKKYIRICLGGVRDEAEIRGHRKTYVGAMPGRITNALTMAKVSNPLILLDEIDKTSSDHRGDTASALLEVLDPEQNMHFLDHYVEIPQDLSEVLFIATANDAGRIPRELLDRMEVIEIAGYTQNEKEHIAKDHLVPKQLAENGLEKKTLVIQLPAISKIITGYTKEAGVRSLERRIGQICRKAAREISEGKKKKIIITSKNLEQYLGREKYSLLYANEKAQVGIVRGLAWTSVGGDTLEIEVNVMPGKGELVLTGQLGDVMKESAQAGISYIRSVAEEYKIDPEFFKKNDIHVHIPEGAVPKDGPSAGITMAAAMLSAIIDREVRPDLAMTGEITLRGRVLPIGGLKEKLLAAKNAKIRQVLVPKANQPVIEELDQEIIDGLQVDFVSSMKEVIDYAFL